MNEVHHDQEQPDLSKADTQQTRTSATAKIAVFAVGAAILGLAAGVVIGNAYTGREVMSLQQDLEAQTAKNTRLDAVVNRLESQVQQARSDADDLIKQEEARLEEWEQDLAEQNAALDERSLALDEREADIEKAIVAKAEAEFGTGLHTVGETVSAGTYRTNVTSGMCYYAWLTGTGSGANIISNNIVEAGPATVTLVDGEIFESSGCGKWTKQ